jgi:hypothetical protein
MRILTIVFSALLLSVLTAAAQTARVQIIHNAPDPVVDIYANGLLLLDDFQFRQATEFQTVPAGVPITIAVAPGNSTSANDAIASFPVTFESGKVYAVTASGVVGDPNTPFTLLVDDNALEASVTAGKVALNVLHGSPDAPAVDVVVRTGGKIVSNLAYGAFTPYLEVNPGVYYLDIKPAGVNAIVATFKADLSALSDGAARVFASGFLGGTPGFGLFAALPDGSVVELPLSPVARVQVIHNSPEPTVDVYANNDLFLDDFEFRTATPFVFVPAETDITLGIAPGASTSVNDTLVGFPVNLVNGKTYVVIANGIVGDPNTPFNLVINDLGREAASDTSKVDVIAFHGSPDAPAVDIAAIFVGQVITDLSFGEFSNYLSLNPGVYDLAIRPTGNPATVAAFRADLSGLKGGSATVFASGLLGGTPDFGLFAALADGTVAALPSTPFARLQVVHNSPEPTVDVYAGNDLLINDFAYRTATPFVDVPADIAFTVGVAPSNSTSSADAIATFPVTLAEGISYTVFAGGIVGDPNTPFNLFAAEAQEEAGNSDNVDISIHHGSTNAPAVDVSAVFEDLTIFNVSYGDITGYLNLPPALYDFAIRPAGLPDLVAMYRADLSGLGGAAARVFASGVLGGSPAFGLFAVLPNGTVIELPASPTARVQVIHNSPDPTVDVYAGLDRLVGNFAFRTATPFVTLPADRDFAVGIAPSGSFTAAEAIATFPFNLSAGVTYAVTASGVLGDPNTPFTLIADANAREAASDPAKVDFNALHGAPDAPAVDIAVAGVGDIITNLAYGEFTGYLSVDPGSYLLDVKPAGQPDIVATFEANLSGLAGGAARVFASGFLGGTPAFGLFAALADGTVVEFPVYTPPTPTARVQIIHNSPSPTVDIYANSDLLLNDFAFRTATGFIDVPAGVNINIGVAPGNSSSVNDVIATFPTVFEDGKTYVVIANGIVGNPVTPFTLVVTDAGREAAGDPSLVDIAVLHGSPDAPAVDVDAVFVGNVLSNLAYGDLTPYLGLTPDVYDLAIRPAGFPAVVATYRADLSALAGGAAVVFASGLLAGTPGFGLFAALPNGDVFQLPATPTARVQVIHNSPNPTVDVYAGEQLLIDNFEFRTATPFVELPADRDFVIGVAPDNSTSASDAIATFPVSLPTGAALTVMAAGIVGDLDTPFNLYVDAAQESAGAGLVNVSVFHGSPDAPAVDVDERLGGSLVTDLAFGEFTPYLPLPTDLYFLDVKVAGTEPIVATFAADLSGLAGQAIRVFASGLLSGTPGFGLFAALTDGTVVELPAFEVARIQVIHNSPSPVVDIYFDDERVLDDFAFRSATGFGYVPAGVNVTVGVAPGSSSSVNDVIASFPVSFENGKNYIVMANGIVGNPTTPFTLNIIENGREVAEDNTKLELGIFHGAPNAPAVDVVPFGETTPLLSNVAYGDFSGYLSLTPDVYLLDIETSAAPKTNVGTWGGDFTPLSGLSGIVFASGLVGQDPAFGLYLAVPNGLVVPLPSFARTQIIHNAPNPTVDVYFNDARVLDNFAFRQATNIGLLPAGTPFTLSVAPANSTSVNDAIYDLDVPALQTGKVYTVMAAGVVGNPTTPFELLINENGRDRAATGSGVDLNLFHGSPDAPEVDVVVPPGLVVFDNIEFGEFSNYVNVPATSYVVNVTPGNNNNTVVASYTADVTSLGGQAATIFASGFLSSGQPGFEVWVALTNGLTFPLPVFVSTNELDRQIESLSLSPNPAIDDLMVRFDLSENRPLRFRVRDLAGRLMMEGDWGTAFAGANAQQLQVGQLSSGMYIMEIVSDNGVKSAKFTVQR